MPSDRAYSETGDQPAMSAVFDMCLAHRRNRSFRKLVKTIGDLLKQLQQPLPDWPPAEWLPQ
jgi:primosomal protein N''